MSLTVAIKVIPNSGRQQWVHDKAGRLKCYLKSAPEHGRANDELLRFLSKLLRIPKEKVAIIMGASARKKVIRIDVPITESQFVKMIGLDKQESFLE